MAALNYAHFLAVVGRSDDAAAQIADGTKQDRREGNAMALDIWTLFDGVVLLIAGRLSAARAATESLPRPARTGATEPDMLCMVILAEVAVRADDRNLLQQTVNDAMRWLGDITLFESPLWPQVLDQVILSARVASAAGDAGLRACPAGHGPARA